MSHNSGRAQARQAILARLAADCACSPDALVSGEVELVEAREHPGRRRYPFPARPLLMVMVGTGVVISAHASRLAWARKHLCGYRPDRIFNGPAIARLARYIMLGKQDVFGPTLTAACSRDTLRTATTPARIEIRVVERAGMAELYQHAGFRNALGYAADNPRPDMVAAVATHEGTVVGVAGASADSELLWQIGVDVVASKRGWALAVPW